MLVWCFHDQDHSKKNYEPKKNDDPTNRWLRFHPIGGACNVFGWFIQKKTSPEGSAYSVLVWCFHDQDYLKKNDDPTNRWLRFHHQIEKMLQ